MQQGPTRKKVAYDRALHACQNDKLGVYGPVADIIGWRDAMELKLLCRLEVVLQRVRGEGVSALEAGEELWRDGGKLAVKLAVMLPQQGFEDSEDEDAAAGLAADQAAEGLVAGEAAPAGRRQRAGQRRPKTLLTPRTTVALLSNLLEDMVSGRHSPALRRTVTPTHAVAYLHSIGRAQAAQALCSLVRDTMAAAAEKEGSSERAHRLRSIFMATVSCYQKARVQQADLDEFASSRLAIVFNVGIMRVGKDIPQVCCLRARWCGPAAAAATGRPPRPCRWTRWCSWTPSRPSQTWCKWQGAPCA